MTQGSPSPAAKADLAYQRRLLEGVARTFALTIRPLPGNLSDVTGNLYLLCRMADTIEDEPALSASEKECFSSRFVALVAGNGDATTFCRDLGARLSDASTENEKELVAGAARILRITARFDRAKVTAIQRCVRVMTSGMVEFQRTASTDGLPDLKHLNRYCYHVAGVVGETLTAFFCGHSADMARKREDLLALSIPFGQGLQMINVLKDIWEDHRRGACWLPRDMFGSAGVALKSLPAARTDPAFTTGLLELVAVARQHLEGALRYTLMIPPGETGIRRFCLWPLGLGLLTLQRIRRNPRFTSGREVRVSRRSVWAVVVVTSVFARWNLPLELLFRLCARGLPQRAGA